jgi:uncharacterized membrane protein YedE/YeeE
MIYLLFAIAGVMSIITAAVINSMSSQPKSSYLKKIIVIGVSLLIYIAVAVYLLSQKGYN